MVLLIVMVILIDCFLLMVFDGVYGVYIICFYSSKLWPLSL